MSKAADRALADSMGRRRPREAIREEVAESILGELVPSGVIEVPAECLYRSPYQVRTMGTDEDIEKLAASIQTSGLISPVVVRPLRAPAKDLQVKSSSENPADDPAGIEQKDLQVKSFEVVTGHHRVLACIKLGWAAIPVVVKKMTDAEAAIALTADNAIKKDLTDWDRFRHIQMLESTGACRTGREVAATLGISTAQVSQIRSFERLPAEVLSKVERHPLTVGYKLAYELVQSGLAESHPELVIEAIDRLVSERIKVQSGVVPWIRLQTAMRSPKTYRREIKIQRPGQKGVRLVVTGEGAVIHAPGVNPDKLSKLIEQNLDGLFSGD